MNMRIAVGVAALALIFGAGAALQAQSTPPPAHSPIITWTAPTSWSDGTPLGTVSLSYQVYAGGAPGSEVKLGTATTATTYTVTPVANSTQCFQVTAIANGIESVKSGEACIGPNAPSVVIITFK